MTPDEIDKWNMHSIVQEAVEKAHHSPSPETLTRLKFLETNQITIMEKMDGLEDKIDKLTLSVAQLPEKIFDKADGRYASKTAEKVIYSMLGAMSLAVLYAVLSLVVVK